MNEKKLKTIIEHLYQKDFDGMIIKDVNNIGYLSNYFPTAFTFCLLEEEPVVYTTSMDLELAESTSNMEVKTIKSLKDLKEILKKENYKKIAVEKTLDVETYQRISGEYELVISDLLEKERMIKTSDEIAKIRMATEIAHKSFKELMEDMETKKFSELTMVYRLGQRLRDNSAEGESFETIFASGSSTSLPHSTPSNKKIDHPILVDWGAKYRRYCSDTTRTMIYSEKEEEVFNIVLEAYTKTIKAIKPGIESNELDKVARDIITEHGFGENFIHSTGHSVGLDIHEEPRIAENNKTTIEKGMVITVEPGIYLKGEFGVRIEDTVHVSNKGEVIGNLKPVL
ncbi:MAG: aminopeptidase P family protein [Methanobrevibacter sp.]|jgi:Xaa-Pro dipeptidase|nr:aminopeptidase P family protein [Candidatus Methanovirga aequatorialis]